MISTQATSAPEQSAGLAGDLARRLISARTAAHLTVEEAAERADVQPNYLRYLESSTCMPSDICLRSIAAALETSEESLLGAVDRPLRRRNV